VTPPTDPGPGPDPVLATLWDAHRRRLLDIAFRILLDLGEAEDAVQEAFSRLATTDLATIDDPEAWLVVVTSRRCVDRLRARQRRPADAVDPFDTFDALAEPAGADAPDPADHVAFVDQVTLAMHALLARLSPAERTSFVLHDVFQFPFDEVATIVGRSPAASRQLASRARRTLRADSATSRFPVDVALQQRLSERFIDACAGGDLEGLLALLDPAVEGAGDIVPAVVVGAADVAPGILRYLGPPASPELLHLPVGDRIGIVALRDRRVLALVVLTIGPDNGLVVHVDALAGPAPRAAVSTVLGLP
jgi:RNA polymerase sigma-70 factor (ECF subfamily)